MRKKAKDIKELRHQDLPCLNYLKRKIFALR